MRLTLITVAFVFCAWCLWSIKTTVDHVCGRNAACRVEMEAPQ